MAINQTTNKIYTGIGLDFETGGRDCVKSACTQIALRAIRFDTLELLDSYVKYFSPYNKMDIGGASKRKVLKNKRELEHERGERMDYEPEALSYSGVTMDMLNNYGVDLNEIAGEVIEMGRKATLTKGFQSKPILIGQNVPFDIGFMQQLMNYSGKTKEFEKVFAGYQDFYGNFQPRYIDTMDLARLALAHDPTMSSYKLEKICESLGIELIDAHDANADINATLNVVRVIAHRIRNGNSNADSIIEKTDKTRNHFKI